jgi:hypothetical protein
MELIMTRYAVEAAFSDGSHGTQITEAADASQAVAQVADHYNKVRYDRRERTVEELTVRLAQPGDYCAECSAIHFTEHN